MKAGLEVDGPFESLNNNNMPPNFCRKRPRSQDDELDESIPISKRINSLNIEGRSDYSPESVPSPDPAIAENGHSDMSYNLWQQQQQQHRQLQSVYGAADNGSKHYPEQSTSSMAPIMNNSHHHPALHSHQQQQLTTPSHLLHSQSNPTDQSSIKKYSPELDESSNPYYYHINEVLYKAHIARLERTTKPLHPHSPHHQHQPQQPFPFSR